MTTVVNNPDGARGFNSNLNKLIGRVPDGTPVYVYARRGDYVEAQNGGWFKNADGTRYESQIVYLLVADLVAPPPDPDPDPTAPVIEITRVEGTVDKVPFVWQP